MPRKLKIDVTLTSGAIAECVIWANHQLVADSAPPATWTGKIPSGPTPMTVEVAGVGTSTYNVTITIDGQVVTDADRDLQGGSDEFEKLV